MHEPAILVIGSAAQTAPVLRALARRRVQAWATEMSRASADPASFAWADAIVVIDATQQAESTRSERVQAFDGPRLLAAAAPLSDGQVASLLDEGFDVVVGWPSPPEAIAARIAALVRAGPREHAATGARRYRRSA